MKPDEAVINIWYDKLYYIPDEATGWIVNQIQELDTLPRNLPKFFRQYWRAWKSEHPEKMTGEKEPCNDCCDEGYFIISKVLPDHTIPTQMMVFCKKCNNVRQKINSRNVWYEQPLGSRHTSKIAVKSRSELELIGHQIIFPPKRKDEVDNSIPTKTEVAEFVNRLKTKNFDIKKGFEERAAEYPDEVPF
jgi:hypothetical protein